MFVSLNFIITVLTFSHGCNYSVDNTILINSHHKALTSFLPPCHPLHQLPIILRWVAALFGSSLKMWVAWCIVVIACMSRTREFTYSISWMQNKKKSRSFWCICVAFSYVILFNFPPLCFLSMFNFKCWEFYWQLFCFKPATASCIYFTVIFNFDFKHQ